MKPEEIKLCGMAAVKARFQRDAASILRLYFDHPTSRRIGVMCKVLAAARRVYRCVEPDELEKIAGTVHHGGIVAVVAAPELRTPQGSDVAGWAARRLPILVLDRIGNAHNLGAIARSAAFFGLDHLVIPSDPAAAGPGEAAFRVAEGGLEHVRVWRVPDLPAFLRAAAASGYDVLGASVRGGEPTPRGRASAPVMLVVGNEEHGLAPEVEKACTRLVTLRGSGRVESLNVSVATAVLLHALART
jgi:RNA methyltransferase, TrmH family